MVTNEVHLNTILYCIVAVAVFVAVAVRALYYLSHLKWVRELVRELLFSTLYYCLPDALYERTVVSKNSEGTAEENTPLLDGDEEGARSDKMLINRLSTRWLFFLVVAIIGTLVGSCQYMYPTFASDCEVRTNTIAFAFDDNTLPPRPYPKELVKSMSMQMQPREYLEAAETRFKIMTMMEYYGWNVVDLLSSNVTNENTSHTTQLGLQFMNEDLDKWEAQYDKMVDKNIPPPTIPTDVNITSNEAINVLYQLNGICKLYDKDRGTRRCRNYFGADYFGESFGESYTEADATLDKQTSIMRHNWKYYIGSRVINDYSMRQFALQMKGWSVCYLEDVYDTPAPTRCAVRTKNASIKKLWQGSDWAVTDYTNKLVGKNGWITKNSSISHLPNLIDVIDKKGICHKLGGPIDPYMRYGGGDTYWDLLKGKYMTGDDELDDKESDSLFSDVDALKMNSSGDVIPTCGRSSTVTSIRCPSPSTILAKMLALLYYIMSIAITVFTSFAFAINEGTLTYMTLEEHNLRECLIKTLEVVLWKSPMQAHVKKLNDYCKPRSQSDESPAVVEEKNK